MSKYKKILIILINLILILFIISNTVLASGLVDAFSEKIDTTGAGASDVEDKAGQIVGLIQVIGTIFSVGMLIILGIKYVLGSADEKAEYRKSMIPYIVGAILIFGFSNITQVIYDWAKQI